MSTDFRISAQFLEHPKTVKLERRLGWPGIKSLLTLWSWATLNRPDGNLGGANARSTSGQRPLDEEDLEIVARWTGEPGLFARTLLALGWLDQTERGFLLHEWVQHNPWVAAATNRSDKARFSRMAKTHPDLYKSLCDQGIREVSAPEFARLKAEFGRSTTVQRPFNDRSTTVETPLTPSPSPSPSPSLEERGRSEPTPVGKVPESEDPRPKMPGSPMTDGPAAPKGEPARTDPPSRTGDSTDGGGSVGPSHRAKVVKRVVAGSGEDSFPAAPDWLPPAVWERWQAHRRALKKPLTAEAARLSLHQLDKARGCGHDPVELIDTAIATGWQGCVFPDKHYRSPGSRSADARDSARRPLREIPANPAVYLETAGFATELEVT